MVQVYFSNLRKFTIYEGRPPRVAVNLGPYNLVFLIDLVHGIDWWAAFRFHHIHITNSTNITLYNKSWINRHLLKFLSQTLCLQAHHLTSYPLLLETAAALVLKGAEVEATTKSTKTTHLEELTVFLPQKMRKPSVTVTKPMDLSRINRKASQKVRTPRMMTASKASWRKRGLRSNLS